MTQPRGSLVLKYLLPSSQTTQLCIKLAKQTANGFLNVLDHEQLMRNSSLARTRLHKNARFNSWQESAKSNNTFEKSVGIHWQLDPDHRTEPTGLHGEMFLTDRYGVAIKVNAEIDRFILSLAESLLWIPKFKIVRCDFGTPHHSLVFNLYDNVLSINSDTMMANGRYDDWLLSSHIAFEQLKCQVPAAQESTLWTDIENQYAFVSGKLRARRLSKIPPL